MKKKTIASLLFLGLVALSFSSCNLLKLLFGGGGSFGAPRNLSAWYDAGTERIMVKWDGVPDAVEYQLYTSMNESTWYPSTQKSPGTSDSILAPRADFGGSRVFVRVTAFNDYGEESDASNSAGVDIPMPNGPPPTPTGFNASVDFSAYPHRFFFSWNSTAGADDFVVKYAYPGSPTWYDTLTTASTAGSVDLVSTDYNASWDFCVVARNAFGDSQPSQVIRLHVPPAELTSISVWSDADAGIITVDWSDVPGATGGYRVFKRFEGGEPILIADPVMASSLTYPVTDFELGTRMWFSVSAYLPLESVRSVEAWGELFMVNYAPQGDGSYRYATSNDSDKGSIWWSTPVNFVSNDPPTTGVHTTMIEVIAKKTSGDYYGGYGVIFGYMSDDDYQVLLINENGQYTVWKWNGAWTTLQAWTSSAALVSGQGMENTIQVRYDYYAVYGDEGTVTIAFNGTDVTSFSPPPGTYTAKVAFVTEVTNDDTPSSNPVSTSFSRIWPE